MNLDPALSADAEIQAWLDIGLLEPLPDLDFAAADADGLAQFPSELSSQPYESSSDDSSLPLPTLDDLANFDVSLGDTPPQLNEALRQRPYTPQTIEHDTVSHVSTKPVDTTPSPSYQSPAKHALPLPPGPQPLIRAPRLFSCMECGIQFGLHHQLSNHRRNNHRRFACTECPKEFRHDKSLWQHRREAHEGFSIRCDKCPYTTGRKGNLKRHQDKKHPVRTDSLVDRGD